ncbi:MAG: metal-dependent hydrolase [Candidatus Nanohaloarchaea archaeon]
MGDFSEHVLFGFLVATLIYFPVGDLMEVEPLTMLAAVSAVFVGSVLPDVDHRKSYVHRSVKAFTSISLGAATFLFLPLGYPQRFGLGIAATLFTYSAFSAVDLEHRGVTHSFSFCITATSGAVIVAVYSIGSAVPGLAMGAGLLSHLLLDREFKL